MKSPTMRPVVFAGCFGWLHRPSHHRSDVGVVLCNPFGYDALGVHGGWRDLAESLAAGGMPALRFDYPGTGDSSGNEEDPDRFRAWLDSVKAAAAYLRAQTGVTRLTLCGVRLGATFAALAAEEIEGIDSIVLLAPVLSGKNYVRELEMQHQAWRSSRNGIEDGPREHHEGAIGAYGFRMYPDTIEQLKAVDLERRAERPAPRVLIHDVCDSARLRRLVDRYRAQGAQVSVEIFGEYGKFLQDPSISAAPRMAFRNVLDWLGVDAHAANANHADASEGGMRSHQKPEVLMPLSSAQIEFDDGVETPVIFGGTRYMGVFCAPRKMLDDAPAVLIVNTGGVHHVGDGRLAVLLSRRLASQGIASLRMDLTGIGDSGRRDDAQSFDVIYQRYSVGDARTGVDWLSSQGYPEVVMFGVCAGAYVGIHTALAHPAVAACMSVNLPFFTWKGREQKENARVIEGNRVYLRSMRDPRKWLRLLGDRTRGAKIAAAVSRRMLARVTARAASPFERLLGVQTSSGAIRKLAAQLERKGVQTALLYGSDDVGLDELEIHFGQNGSELSKLSKVTVEAVDSLDHALFSYAARDTVMRYFERFMRERVLSVRERALVA
ncbi:alpha/beta fold hydrolase [Paraburkholderia sp.]|uniref:alpha/beta fold hydrolase n=1 Tax=Paraburkholderia sp. TaxID=1926495 RepID=UPI00238C8BF8|nr:alpha/beta fold hydrolase [Paraburkholderia sp.]MDE1182614.1 alpha/beta fold hydrolase [Paraburkholderia sp.]